MDGHSTGLRAAAPIASTDNLGCLASQLDKNQKLFGADVQFYRKRSGDLPLGRVETPASDRGVLIGVSMRGDHKRRIFHERHATSHEFDADSIYIRNFDEDYQADLSGAFDFILMEIAPAGLQRLRDERKAPNFGHLVCEAGQKDPVLAHLVRALVPAFERPEEASRLFIDHLTTAIGTYLVQRYGENRIDAAVRSRVLSRSRERLAKELLRDRLDGDVSIAEVAEACDLSRGYFIRAFRETTGQTPYQWLLNQRIERARDLLRSSSLPLVEIAIACGFADQSHFTRVFTSAMGTAPGNWRRTTLS